MIPATYSSWRTCIIDKCEIPLTRSFAEERLSIYENKASFEKAKFVELYGEAHLLFIIDCYKQALSELSP